MYGKVLWFECEMAPRLVCFNISSPAGRTVCGAHGTLLNTKPG